MMLWCNRMCSVNQYNYNQESPVSGTIGMVPGSMEFVLFDPESKNIEVAPGSKGMLLVRSENVFFGYLPTSTTKENSPLSSLMINSSSKQVI